MQPAGFALEILECELGALDGADQSTLLQLVNTVLVQRLSSPWHTRILYLQAASGSMQVQVWQSQENNVTPQAASDSCMGTDYVRHAN